MEGLGRTLVGTRVLLVLLRERACVVRIFEKGGVREMLENRGSAAGEPACLEQLKDQLKPSLHEPIRVSAKASSFFLETFAIGAMTCNGLGLLEVMEDSERRVGKAYGYKLSKQSQCSGGVGMAAHGSIVAPPATATDAVRLDWGGWASCGLTWYGDQHIATGAHMLT
jgi:hypothetical protein